MCVCVRVHSRGKEKQQLGSKINEAANRGAVSAEATSQLGSNTIVFPGQLSRSGPLLFPTLKWCF